MSLFGWLVFGWVGFSIVRAIGTARTAAGGTGGGPSPRRTKPPRPGPARPTNAGALDAREAWRAVLEQVERGRPQTLAVTPKPAATARSKWEEGVSREAALPPPVDYDDEAERVVQRRIAEARARDRATGPAEHAAFDARIRAPGPEPDARVALTRAELRRAFLWRELLGPPVALRD